ncbi:septum formation family protein [Nonomuraea sp. K274]|uniref:Septum formation family protein n=1 Tax=Nonomuraea cypriaca TaxID=1187855 RepID=A0A931EWZ7_9ACTN|nr:septum formation family protein [Nonomuraea cypriaca]MBF8185720.1 septum formation family protein [Nonomuraea cypriaca]
MVRFSLAIVCLTGTLLGCAAAPDETRPVSSSPGQDPTEVVTPASERYHATDLRPGDCVEPMPADFVVTVVSCDVPHAAEFATTYVLRQGPWPGVEEMRTLIEQGCGPRMRYVESRRAEVGVTGLVPLESDWPRHRTVYCLAVPVGGGKLVGRVIK